jgi:hypothetical protein
MSIAGGEGHEAPQNRGLVASPSLKSGEEENPDLPRGEETGLRLEDEGVRMSASVYGIGDRKIVAADPLPPGDASFYPRKVDGVSDLDLI